ncbi:hypothetical protein HMI55_007264 [Coelomomyces lativittatus]|nr:hypothetical protein HMI55_007264 [Coelomomyces lativittatus]
MAKDTLTTMPTSRTASTSNLTSLIPASSSNPTIPILRNQPHSLPFLPTTTTTTTTTTSSLPTSKSALSLHEFMSKPWILPLTPHSSTSMLSSS